MTMFMRTRKYEELMLLPSNFFLLIIMIQRFCCLGLVMISLLPLKCQDIPPDQPGSFQWDSYKKELYYLTVNKSKNFLWFNCEVRIRFNRVNMSQIKFSFSEKATKICAICLMVLLSKCQNHKADCANSCGLLRKAELSLNKWSLGFWYYIQTKCF